MEGSQYLQTPPSSDDEEEGLRVVEEDDDPLEDELEDARYCNSCEKALSLKEKGPKCYPCFRESMDALQYAHKQPMSVQEDEKPMRSRVEKSIKMVPVTSKRATKYVKRALEREEDSDEPVAGVPEDVPDLGAYFALFRDFSELDQVVYCRAYATMLSTKSAKNRMRYSKKAGEKWAVRDGSRNKL